MINMKQIHQTGKTDEAEDAHTAYHTSQVLSWAAY